MLLQFARGPRAASPRAPSGYRRSPSAPAHSAAAAAAASQSNTSITYLPRCTGDVRIAVESGQDAALPQQAEAVRICQASRAGSGCPAHSECRNAWPAAHPQRCSWPSADRARCGLPASRCRTAFPSRAASNHASVLSKSGNRNRSGTGVSSGSADAATATAKFVGQRLRPRVGQHAPDLLFQHRRIPQLTLAGHAEQLARPEALLHRKNESREASSRSLMR